MLIEQKKDFNPKLKKQLQEYIYDIVGVIQTVHNELPQGMPEYIYQEALAIALDQTGIKPEKEYQHHPVFRGKPMQSFLKMDLVVPRRWGQTTPNREQSSSFELPRCEGGRAVEQANVIIECKALEKLTSKEYQQLFSYMLGTGFPIGILVNFHAYPHVVIHKFYYDRKDHTITAF